MIQSFRRFLLDRMVLRPSRHPIEFAPQQRVMLDARPGPPLECFVQRSYSDEAERPELLILKFPGTAGRAERSTPFPTSMMGDVRAAIWTWNPPGYGRSGGRASLPKIGDAAIDFWKQVTTRQRGPQTSVWLCGNSLGCAPALHVAASVQPDRDCSGLILRNPPPLLTVVKRIARQYPLGHWMDPVVDTLCDSMNVMMTAPRVQLPAVFLQSELDTLVPVADQNQVIKAFAGPRHVVLMRGLEHGGIATEQHEPLIQRSIDWLWEQSGCKSNEPQGA